MTLQRRGIHRGNAESAKNQTDERLTGRPDLIAASIFSAEAASALTKSEQKKLINVGQPAAER
jgi:hypothetical protein